MMARSNSRRRRLRALDAQHRMGREREREREVGGGEVERRVGLEKHGQRQTPARVQFAVNHSNLHRIVEAGQLASMQARIIACWRQDSPPQLGLRRDTITRLPLPHHPLPPPPPPPVDSLPLAPDRHSVSPSPLLAAPKCRSSLAETARRLPRSLCEH